MSTIADIEAEARDLCDADTTSYPASDMLRRVNYAYEQIVGWLINADGTWQFDDTNYTDFPIGTFTLVNSQGKYSFNDQFLQLMDVQILDQDGNYSIIDPIDPTEQTSNVPLEEQYETDGRPIRYDKLTDDTIKLYPAPDNGVSVTLAAGLKIRFKRTADLYTSAEVTTGTKVPGFVSTFHHIISYMAAIPYCMKYKKDRVGLYEKRVGEIKEELINHYGKREKDKKKQIIVSPITFK